MKKKLDIKRPDLNAPIPREMTHSEWEFYGGKYWNPKKPKDKFY